jgi:hypothetical protein
MQLTLTRSLKQCQLQGPFWNQHKHPLCSGININILLLLLLLQNGGAWPKAGGATGSIRLKPEIGHGANAGELHCSSSTFCSGPGQAQRNHCNLASSSHGCCLWNMLAVRRGLWLLFACGPTARCSGSQLHAVRKVHFQAIPSV